LESSSEDDDGELVADDLFSGFEFVQGAADMSSPPGTRKPSHLREGSDVVSGSFSWLHAALLQARALTSQQLHARDVNVTWQLKETQPMVLFTIERAKNHNIFIFEYIGCNPFIFIFQSCS
jgi:hypothetical protein